MEVSAGVQLHLLVWLLFYCVTYSVLAKPFIILRPIALIFYCCITLLQQTYCLKIKHIYYLIGPVGQKSQRSSAGDCFRVSQAAIKVSVWAVYQLRLHWGRIHFQAHMVAAFSSLQAAGPSAYFLLLARGHPQLLAMWPSLKVSTQHSSLLQNQQKSSLKRWALEHYIM